MKTLIILGIVVLLLSFSACTTAGQNTITISSTTAIPSGNYDGDVIMVPLTPIPASTPVGFSGNQTQEAYDDIVPTPGGFAYRANVHQQGVPDKWPPVQTTTEKLNNTNGTISLTFRSEIETKAGEIRYNLFEVSKLGDPFAASTLILYSGPLPDGIDLVDYGGGGRPGVAQAVFAIYISPDISPGQYSFYIGVNFNGVYYGTVPCTLTVIQ